MLVVRCRDVRKGSDSRTRTVREERRECGTAPPTQTLERGAHTGSYAPSLTVTSSVITWHSSDRTLTSGTVPVTPATSAVTV